MLGWCMIYEFRSSLLWLNFIFLEVADIMSFHPIYFLFLVWSVHWWNWLLRNSISVNLQHVLRIFIGVNSVCLDICCIESLYHRLHRISKEVAIVIDSCILLYVNTIDWFNFSATSRYLIDLPNNSIICGFSITFC